MGPKKKEVTCEFGEKCRHEVTGKLRNAAKGDGSFRGKRGAFEGKKTRGRGDKITEDGPLVNFRARDKYH